MAEQVLVRGLNLGWITITGVDAETTITHTALTTNFTLADYGFTSYPAFGASKGGVLPRINQLFNMNLGVSGAASSKHGVMTIGAGSSANIVANKGVRFAGTHGIYANVGSTINATSANASSAGAYGIYAASASTINAQSANASSAGAYGIYANAGSTINAQSANTSSAGERGIFANMCSWINARETIIQNQSSAFARITVTEGSHIEATGINTTGGTSTVLSQTVNTLTANGIIYQ